MSNSSQFRIFPLNSSIAFKFLVLFLIFPRRTDSKIRRYRQEGRRGDPSCEIAFIDPSQQLNDKGVQPGGKFWPCGKGMECALGKWYNAGKKFPPGFGLLNNAAGHFKENSKLDYCRPIINSLSNKQGKRSLDTDFVNNNNSSKQENEDNDLKSNSPFRFRKNSNLTRMEGGLEGRSSFDFTWRSCIGIDIPDKKIHIRLCNVNLKQPAVKGPAGALAGLVPDPGKCNEGVFPRGKGSKTKVCSCNSPPDCKLNMASTDVGSFGSLNCKPSEDEYEENACRSNIIIISNLLLAMGALLTIFNKKI